MCKCCHSYKGILLKVNFSVFVFCRIMLILSKLNLINRKVSLRISSLILGYACAIGVLFPYIYVIFSWSYFQSSIFLSFLSTINQRPAFKPCLRFSVLGFCLVLRLTNIFLKNSFGKIFQIYLAIFRAVSILPFGFHLFDSYCDILMTLL